jgi:hypothetical protein
VVEDTPCATVRICERVDPLKSVVSVGNDIRDGLGIHRRRVADPRSKIEAQILELDPHVRPRHGYSPAGTAVVASRGARPGQKRTKHHAVEIQNVVSVGLLPPCSLLCARSKTQRRPLISPSESSSSISA